MSVIDWAAQARRRSWLPKIFSARSYLRGNWVAEVIMVMKMPKNRRVVKEICHRLGSSGAECTSQQKVDTFFIFYTLKTEHSTPYIVLVSNSLMSMQVFLH